MAHGITNTDSMFYVGAKPWHGLGTELPQLATAAEALEAANLGWTVRKESIFLADGQEVADHFATVREDTNEPLGVVGTKYRILQNTEAFTFYDYLTQDPNGPKYETAGSLWGGTKIWLMAKLDEDIQIAPNDTVGQYLILSNSHDGSSAVNIMLSPIRVVCQNTLNMASHAASKKVKIRHSGNIQLKLNDVQESLGIIRQSFNETFEIYRQMVDTKPTAAQVDTVLRALFPDTKNDRASIQRGRVKELAYSGKGNYPVRGTAWALYNGITELSDHVNGEGSKRDDKADYRLNSAWF